MLCFGPNPVLWLWFVILPCELKSRGLRAFGVLFLSYCYSTVSRANRSEGQMLSIAVSFLRSTSLLFMMVCLLTSHQMISYFRFPFRFCLVNVQSIKSAFNQNLVLLLIWLVKSVGLLILKQ